MTDNAEPAAQDVVLYERIDDHIALVTLNRPDTHNAVNGPLALALGELTQHIEADPTIRVAVLAARGRSFCAGVDLKALARGQRADISPFGAGFAGFVYAPRAKPWIAAVQGAALGGGTELALACDLIVAGGPATFGLPEVKRGLIAGAGGCYRIARSLPRAIAIEMVIGGDRIDARRAYDLGLVNRLVDGGSEIAAALELARGIAVNAPSSVRESLRLVRSAADGNEAGLRSMQADAVAAVLASPNATEGPRAFVEKRPPRWVG